MKKKYFLITILIAFLLPNFFSTISSTNNENNYQNYQSEEINIDSSKYLNLSYQKGNFYSWNQIDNVDQHIIGIFTENEQSYLLDNVGIFWTLDYQIINFYRIDNKNAIVQIAYFQDENKEEYFNKNFFVQLENNKMIIIGSAIRSENPYFAVLKENDVKYIVAYGIGLDLIEIKTQNVKTLIRPADNSRCINSFYSIDNNSGIFIGSDQYFYLLKDITGTLTQVKINLRASTKNNPNNVVVINDRKIVIRDKENALYFVELNQNVIVNAWKKLSIAKNIAFVLNEDTFILNVSEKNSGSENGIPYLIKVNNWNNLIRIPNIKSIKNFMIISNNNGIFIDKNLTANMFTYQNNNDSFILSNFGTLNSFQFVNNNLFFGTFQNQNLLMSHESNQVWSAKKNIQFISNGNGNLLNTVIRTKEADIEYQNTYFSDESVNFSINDNKLVEVVILSKSEKNILKPKRNNVTYTFLNFDDYHIIIKFVNNDLSFSLDYYVKIKDFSNKSLINISGPNITSYVGYAKITLENKLYDIKSINQSNTFRINKYNYNYLQYVQLFVYDDTKNMVVKNVFNLSENNEIKINDSHEIFFFGLKIVNLLNQVSWIYLGFNKNGVQPMLNFWDTSFGKNLMNKALARRHLKTDLKNMNSQQIQKLIQISVNWQAIEIQGKLIIIGLISIFFIALMGMIFSIGYNIFLNKKILITEWWKK
ncbi:MAG: hypothetical protein ACRC8P_02045 [Spiroplasma sp.]